MTDYFFNLSPDEIEKRYVPFLRKGIISKSLYDNLYESYNEMLPLYLSESKETFNTHDCLEIVNAIDRYNDYYIEEEKSCLFSVYYLLLNFVYGKQSVSDIAKLKTHYESFFIRLGNLPYLEIIDLPLHKIIHTFKLCEKDTEYLYELAVKNIAKKCRISEVKILNNQELRNEIDNLNSDIYDFIQKYAKGNNATKFCDIGISNCQYGNTPYYNHKSFMVIPYDIAFNNNQKRNLNKEMFVRY